MKTRPLPPPINLMVGTAGHIDHGKTELVKMFTGCETDTLREEKERGMSINLGFAPCPLGRGKRIGLVDVPGHEDFIRNMVAGVTGIDIVMLVVAADDGIMPQTIEHFNITDLLGVKKGVIVISKVDLVEEERVKEVESDLVEFSKGTFLEGAPIIHYSSQTGAGVGDVRKYLDQVVDETVRRQTDGVFRLPVERFFQAEGFGTIMTGIAAAGKLTIRDEVEILPISQKGVVRKLQVFGQDCDEGFAGQCLAINVGGVDAQSIKRGFVLSTAGYFEPTETFHARLRILRDASAPFKNRTAIRFHTGTSESFGSAVLLDKDALKPGEEGLAQILLDSAVLVEPGDRYIIRLQNPVVTVGGGSVIGRSEKRYKRNRSWIIEGIKEEEASLGSDRERAVYMIGRAGRDGIDRKELTRRAALTLSQTGAAIEALIASDDAVLLPGKRLLVSDDTFESFIRDLEAKLAELHEKDPLRIGYTATELRKEMDAISELNTAALEKLVEKGRVVLDGDRHRLASFEVRLDDEQAQAAARIEEIYRDGGFKTPSPDEMPELVEGKEIPKILQKLIESGVLIKVAPKIIFHKESVEKARAATVEYIEKHGELDSYNFKNLIDSSRKYAIPLLDYLDTIGVTVRGHQNKRYLKK